jgi:hypothetical protein
MLDGQRTLGLIRKRLGLWIAVGILLMVLAQIAETGTAHWVLNITGAVALAVGGIYGLRSQFIEGKAAQEKLKVAGHSNNSSAGDRGSSRPHGNHERDGEA